MGENCCSDFYAAEMTSTLSKCSSNTHVYFWNSSKTITVEEKATWQMRYVRPGAET